MKTDLAAQIQAVTNLLRQAEMELTNLLCAARAQGLSFGLMDNHIDEDVAHLRGRLHYMQLIVEHHPLSPREQERRPQADDDEPPTPSL